MTRSTNQHVVVLAGVLCAFLVRPPAVYAQGTAVVEVASGDTIKGDVRRLEHGRLDFRTPAASTPGAERWAGTISILWSEITLIASSEQLEVELASGEWFVGTISTPSSRRLIVQTASGPTRPIDMNTVVKIIRIEHGFRSRTTGSLSFGLTLVRDARTYNLSGDASHQSAGHAYESNVSFDSYLVDQEGVDSLTRNVVAFDTRRRLGNRWFALAMGEVQQDDELELDARFLAGGGIGRKLIQSDLTELSVQGGVDYDAEKYAGFGSYDQSAELFAGVNWNWFAPGHDVEATADATTFISLARARARLELDARLRHDLLWDLFWEVKGFGSFDGDPPAGFPKNNLGVTFLLGWTF